MKPIDLVPDSEIRTWVGPFWDSARYLESGRQECARLVQLSSMKPTDHVLDVGCGCGRIAIHLAGYLVTGGAYVGFDNCAPLIQWCDRRIRPHYPSFRFQYADIYSANSNPGGLVSPRDVCLETPSSATDVALAVSLFTHMRIEDIRPYLQEVHRVLKPNGRLLATYFLLNSQSESSIAAGTATYAFVDPVGPDSKLWIIDGREEATAHREETILEMYKSIGYTIDKVIRGGWIRNSLEDHQDLVVASKLGGT